jgi:hypothetical protein
MGDIGTRALSSKGLLARLPNAKKWPSITTAEKA